MSFYSSRLSHHPHESRHSHGRRRSHGPREHRHGRTSQPFEPSVLAKVRPRGSSGEFVYMGGPGVFKSGAYNPLIRREKQREWAQMRPRSHMGRFLPMHSVRSFQEELNVPEENVYRERLRTRSKTAGFAPVNAPFSEKHDPKLYKWFSGETQARQLRDLNKAIYELRELQLLTPDDLDVSAAEYKQIKVLLIDAIQQDYIALIRDLRAKKGLGNILQVNNLQHELTYAVSQFLSADQLNAIQRAAEHS